MSLHILVAISANGLGHLAQTAPVINELGRARPDATFTIHSGLERSRVESRVTVPFEFVAATDDFGLVMRDSFDPDVEVTAARYEALHARIGDVVTGAAADLVRRRVDLVVADVGYVVLAAAQRAGLANVAFSSLHWADILDTLFPADHRMDEISREIRAIYRGCDAFVRLEPGLEMADVATVTVREPIALRGRERRTELRARLGCGDGVPIVAFSFSNAGNDPRPPFASGAAARVACIGPDRWANGGPWLGSGALGMPFLDVIASADLVVAKPGYGIATEVVVAGAPCLLIPRPDWPDAQVSTDWTLHHGRAVWCERGLDTLTLDDLLAAIGELAARKPTTVPFAPGAGARRVAEEILRRA